MGHLQEQEGRLDVRRTWLRRVRDGHVALILDFAPTGRGFTVPSLPSLQTAALQVRFVPTLHPQRALLAGVSELLEWSEDVPDLPAASIAELYSAYARALALDPWLERTAFSIGPVRVLPDPAQAQDAFGHAVPLSGVDPFALLAEARGGPLNLFGEWNGASFTPLMVQQAEPALSDMEMQA